MERYAEEKSSLKAQYSRTQRELTEYLNHQLLPVEQKATSQIAKLDKILENRDIVSAH